MRIPLLAVFLCALLMPSLVPAAPFSPEPRLHPSQVSGVPSSVRKVEPAIVGLKVRVAPDRPSAATLGTQRFATAAIFDPRGYAITVSYVLLDAERIEARLRDGSTVRARLVGIDLEVGVGVVQLQGKDVWPAATLGDSQAVREGTATATVGVDEDNDLVAVSTEVQAVQRFAAAWEYMLPRAFFVAPSSPAFGGSALVNGQGEVVGVASLRLGRDPERNLVIPVEHFVSGRDELIAVGRVSRPARPWLGLYTAMAHGGILITGFSPHGPAAAAGFRQNDQILEINGTPVTSQEQFYARLWEGRAGDHIAIGIRRRSGAQTITVKSMDRYAVFRTTAR
jgi:S1-C subfamily serine protease